jgi:tetratricopeptide (TPR) repeat protein
MLGFLDTTKWLRQFLIRVMKKQTLQILFGSLFVCSWALAQGESKTNTELFEEANELYRVENYPEAIRLYEKIEHSGMVSSELYYNLGNAYYKINEVAPSIYNLEKSLIIDPQNSDAVNNLIFANRMAIDAIEELPTTFFQNLETAIVHQLSFDQWAYVSVCCSILMCLFFLFYYFAYIPARKRSYFVISILASSLLLISLLFTYKQHDRAISSIYAIVFDEKVSVKSAPLSSGQEVFEIHEGLKISILDEVDVWKKIKLADGKTGWIPSESLKVL